MRWQAVQLEFGDLDLDFEDMLKGFPDGPSPMNDVHMSSKRDCLLYGQGGTEGRGDWGSGAGLSFEILTDNVVVEE